MKLYFRNEDVWDAFKHSTRKGGKWTFMTKDGRRTTVIFGERKYHGSVQIDARVENRGKNVRMVVTYGHQEPTSNDGAMRLLSFAIKRDSHELWMMAREIMATQRRNYEN